MIGSVEEMRIVAFADLISQMSELSQLRERVRKAELVARKLKSIIRGASQCV